MNPLPPWANGPFELVVHAERHRLGAGDSDRRVALISFDNAIEVTIATYLALPPMLRGGRSYPKQDITQWMKDYHTKLDFLEKELGCRETEWLVERAHIIWAHDQRNEQYHSGQKGIPELNAILIARTAALWVFSVLFDVRGAEAALERALLDQSPPAPPSREKSLDMAIDARYGIIAVCEQEYYASELLFAVDYAAYRDLGGKLIDDSRAETIGEVES